MITLSYGYKLPETGDKGTVFFPALEDNIQRTNDHSHNGSNSSKLSALAMVPTSSSIDTTNWVDQGDGIYRRTITMPSVGATQLKYDEVMVEFRKASSGEKMYLKTEKITDYTYYLYSNHMSFAGGFNINALYI